MQNRNTKNDTYASGSEGKAGLKLSFKNTKYVSLRYKCQRSMMESSLIVLLLPL